jgi:quaternary ammonium compound-resistance protein SugE
MSWILLIVAGLLEACWVVGLKYTDGFSKLFPSLVVGSAIAGSMALLAIAVRNLPIGIAYAVWVGIGVVGAALAQPLLFGQSLRPVQIAFLCLLLISTVGLKLTS